MTGTAIAILLISDLVFLTYGYVKIWREQSKPSSFKKTGDE